MAGEKLLAQRASPALWDGASGCEWMWGDAVLQEMTEHSWLRKEDGGKSKLRPRSWPKLHGVQKHHENSKHQPAALGNANIPPEAGPLKPLMLKTVVVPIISCLQVEQSDFGSVFQVHLDLIPTLEKSAQS